MDSFTRLTPAACFAFDPVRCIELVFAGVRVIISMLPSTSNVQRAYLGRDGIVHAEGGVRPSLLIDCSTIDPQSSREIAAEVQHVRLHHNSRPFEGCSAAHPAMIDAPVSGGVTGASASTLTFMVEL